MPEILALLRSIPSRIGAATLVETSVVATARRHAALDEILRRHQVEVEPFTHEHARVAREAYVRFGRRSGSKAKLNFGDCLSYAVAKVRGEPLLFKGDDFTHTDIESAL